MAYTLGGNTLPNVSREMISKSSNILVIPKPRDDGDSSFTLDFLGVTTRISVEGTIAGSTAIDSFITTFLGAKADLTGGLVDGVQASIAYTGSHSIGVGGAGVQVKVLDIKANSSATETEEIMRYTINLVQG